MARATTTVLMILVCSLLTGCSVTLGPRVEKKTVIVKAGMPLEILENVTVEAKLLKAPDGEVDVFEQDIGGWVAMPPEHWGSVKKEINRLRAKCGEPSGGEK
ncbi:MAG: hypothetical protein JXR97_16930 [Planctomycetes bacterium]|nr:hypothetical protein [Planctomycetota bacterium]